MVGGTKGEGLKTLAPPLLFLPSMDLAARNPGFLAPGAWRIAGERGRRERETWEKGFSYSLA